MTQDKIQLPPSVSEQRREGQEKEAAPTQLPCGEALSETELRALARKNEGMKGALNKLHYALKSQLQRKQRLAEQYRTLIQANADYERDYSGERLSHLEDGCEQLNEQILGAELDNGMYRNLRLRERRQREELRLAIEQTKVELRKAGDLGGESAQIGAYLEATKGESKGELRVSESDFKEKLAEGRQRYEELNQQIVGSAERLERHREDQKLFLRRQERLARTIRQLKGRREGYEALINKFRRYRDEYVRQYEQLAKKLHVHRAEQIAERKERLAIEQQSEFNEHQQLVDRIRRCGLEHWALCEQLAELKAARSTSETSAQKERLLDKGEYNRDVASSQVVENAGQAAHYQWMIEEKLDLVRQAISGVKNILFKLQDNDKACETGTWPDLAVIAAIDEISNPHTRPHFSKLLLILEQKITTFITLVMQNIRHMNKMSWEDIDIEADTISPNYLLESGMLACCQILNDHVKKIETKGNRASIYRRASVMGSRSAKPVAGISIPQLVDPTEKKQEKTKQESQDSEKAETEAKTSSQPGEKIQKVRQRDSMTALVQEIDMLKLNNAIFDECKKSRLGAPKVAPVEPAKLQSIADMHHEMEAINEKFVTNRSKQKRELRRLKEKLASGEAPVVLPVGRKKKKRVTELTEQIEREMVNRPQEIIDVATETFDALDKANKTTPGPLSLLRNHKEKDFFRQATPNFVSVVLNLKKARKDERIEKIAPKCHYFPMESQPISPSFSPRVLARPSTTSAASTSSRISTLTIRQPKPTLIQTYEQRIGHLKSLTQLDKLPQNSITAFEKFYFANKPSTPLGRPRLQSPSMTIATTSRPATKEGPMAVFKRQLQTFSQSSNGTPRSYAKSTAQARLIYSASLQSHLIKMPIQKRILSAVAGKAASPPNIPSGKNKISHFRIVSDLTAAQSSRLPPV